MKEQKLMISIKLINNAYLELLKVIIMAATPKGPQKVRAEYNIDKPTYDDFVRMCSRKGFTPTVIVERLMKKYNEQGGQV